MDMVCLVPDRGVIVLAPHLVNYGFVRRLKERDWAIVEVPVEEYWDLAVNGVTLAPGKVVINRGSPRVVEALERLGIEVLQVDFSESQKFAIAGLHCATLELVREQTNDG
jgi:N-dimethylarginine dimethylaminohydrolase